MNKQILRRKKLDDIWIKTEPPPSDYLGSELNTFMGQRLSQKLNKVPVKSTSKKQVLQGLQILDLEANTLNRTAGIEKKKENYAKLIKSILDHLAAKGINIQNAKDNVQYIITACYLGIWSNSALKGRNMYLDIRTLSDGISTGEFGKEKVLNMDCDTSSFIICDVLSQFGIKAKLVRCSMHALVRVKNPSGSQEYYESTPKITQNGNVFDIESAHRMNESEVEMYHGSILYEFDFDVSNNRTKSLIIANCNNFEQALELDSKNPMAYFGLGTRYLDEHKFDLAVVYLKKALEISKNFNKAICNLGTVYVHMKKYNEGISLITRALDMFLHEKFSTSQKYNESDRFSAYVNRSVAYSNTMQYAKALADINKALEIYPTNETALDIRRQIKQFMGK